MRGLLVMAMLVASLSSGTWNEVDVERELTVDTLAADFADFEENLTKYLSQLDESFVQLDESFVASPALATDAPCASWHEVSDTDYSAPDII